MKTFVIHLDRATGRKAAVAELLKVSPFEAEILPACDGAAMQTAERDALYPGPSHFEPRYPFALGAGEIGCFVSHIRAWQKIVDEDLPGALILEDDVEVDQSLFAPAVAFCQTHLETHGYIQLQVRRVPEDALVLAEGGGFKLVRPKVAPLRTSAQLVSRKAAEILLEKNRIIDRPVDGMLQLNWEIGFPMVCVVPSGVRDLTQATGGSTISRKRTVWAALMAEINRAVYRARIKALSRKYLKDQSRR